jgi:hypothetical protein
MICPARCAPALLPVNLIFILSFPDSTVIRYPDTPASARLLEVIHEDMYCEQYTGPMAPERRALLENACEAQRSAVRLAQEGNLDQAIVRY